MAKLPDLLAYAFVRGAEWLLRSLPPEVALRGAEGAGEVWHAVDARRRARVRENLRVALGASPVDPASVRRAERAVFRNMMRVPAEVLVAPRLLSGKGAFSRRVRLVGDWDLLARDAAVGGGVVLTAHLGNWEVGARALRHAVPRARVVVRPIENRAIDDHATRARGGPDAVIRKRGAVRESLEALRGGAWVALLADQDAGRRGVFVPFFGLAASTSSAPQVLAVRAGVPLYVGACVRRGGRSGAFDVHLCRLEDPGGPSETARVEDLVRQASQEIERRVRGAMDQYNWLHRRWKTRPRGEAAGTRVPTYARPAMP